MILGGPYATFAYEKAHNYADSVAIGEAEGLWEQLLADFERGHLQSYYQRTDMIEFRTSVKPR